MKVSVNKEEKILNIFIIAILSVFAITMAAPFIWMISTSLKTSQQIFIVPPEWMPNPFTWGNYEKLFEYSDLGTAMLNTFKIAFIVIIVGTFTSSMAAFAFAKLKFPYKDQLFLALLGSMMIPYAVVMIPQFVVFSKLNWVDTHLPLILPGLFGNVAMIFFLKQYLTGIPDEMIEASKIDGCSFFMIYWKIILPNIKPAIAAHVILWFMGIWNDFLGPVIYLNSPDKLTIQVLIATFNSLYQTQTDFGMVMAASLISTLPIIIIYIAGQKYFIEGFAISGIKG